MAGNSSFAFLRLLGPVQVVTHSGDTLEIPSVSQRRVLAVLGVHANRTLRGDFLADVLEISPAALRTSVSRLRKLLGDHFISTDAVGYKLNVTVDTEIFGRLLSDAGNGGDPIQLLDAALALWRGVALDEFQHESWACGESARLTELHATAVENRSELLLAAGRHSEVIASLESHVAVHPFRDRPRGLMMMALAAAGRRTDALRAYQSYRCLLADEVGMEPSSELRLIEEHISSGSDRVERKATDRTPGTSETPGTSGTPNRSLTKPSGDLPTYRTSFIGRAAEIDTIERYLASTSIVTLTGPAGVGKTRLAVQIGAQHAGMNRDVRFVDLSAADDRRSVVVTVARALGGESYDPDALVNALRDRPTLLLVDNCEHVLTPAADMIDDLVGRCPKLSVLATSREPLALYGQQVVPIPVFDCATDAVELFRQRAEGAGVTLTGASGELVEGICRRLDGIPLAIELAATQLRGLGLHTLCDSLDDRFTVLVGNNRMVDRHQTLRAATEWSYRLLTGDLQLLFRSLGALNGSFELAAVEDLWVGLGCDAGNAGMLIAALVDRNMVVIEEPTGRTRYRLFETMRAFAMEHLDVVGETDRVLEVVARRRGNGRGTEPAPVAAVPQPPNLSVTTHGGAHRSNWAMSV